MNPTKASRIDLTIVLGINFSRFTIFQEGLQSPFWRIVCEILSFPRIFTLVEISMSVLICVNYYREEFDIHENFLKSYNTRLLKQFILYLLIYLLFFCVCFCSVLKF